MRAAAHASLSAFVAESSSAPDCVDEQLCATFGWGGKTGVCMGLQYVGHPMLQAKIRPLIADGRPSRAYGLVQVQSACGDWPAACIEARSVDPLLKIK